MATRMRLKSLRTDFKIVRFHMRTLFWEPLIVGVLVAYFLSSIPQSREVYLSLIEGIASGSLVHLGQALLGVALIALLCMLLHVWQCELGTAAIDRIYPEHADIRTDRSLLSWRDFLASWSALLPFLGLIGGLVKMTYEAHDVSENFADVLGFIGGTQSKTMGFGTASSTGILPQLAHFGALAAALLIAGLVVLIVFRRPILNRLLGGRVERAYAAIVWIGAAVTLVALVVPLLAPVQPYVVGLSRLVGPLASAALVLIAATCALMTLSFAANMKRLPVKGTLAAIAIVGVVVLIYWALSPPPQKIDEIAADPSAAPQKSAERLTRKFEEWISARAGADWPKYRAKGADYPVFIIAAEGGGIYAADAATSFLSAMQDMCPSFSQHVFAISAVSGGAVGSALFNAEQAGKKLVTEDCNLAAELFGKDTLSSRTSAMVRDDHLSPALTMIVPDVASRIWTWGRSDRKPVFDRSSALEASFACSLLSPGLGGLRCDRKDGTGVDVPFDGPWKPADPAPALVLTSTWVETGYRVAFSPFPLHGASDGTLFSFPLNDNEETDDFKAHRIRIEAGKPPTLIQAAMVSARFPGIVPAYSVEAKIEGRDRKVSWNFVDGGYVDNSGSSTALEIYQKLEERLEEARTDKTRALPIDRVRMFLVLLTDANYDPNLRDVADGTAFSDTIAPVSALMSVRGQLAGRAVTRAIDQLEPKATATELSGRGTIRDGSGERPARVMIVNLKQDNFNLPLGWKISNVTDGVVRIMLGHPSLCRERDPKAKPNDIKTVVQDNSCVKKRIIDLLDGRAPRRTTTDGS